VGRLHEDELPIDLDLVRRLVDRSFPEHSALDLRALDASGSSNALFRLGDELLVRVPRQPGGSATITKESRWVPFVASRLSVAVPRVLAVGEPAFGYPEKWSITQWIDGEPPPVPNRPAWPLAARQSLAHDLATTIRELRGVEVPDAARNDESLSWYRGHPLGEADADFRDSLAACRGLDGLELDLDATLRCWESVLASDTDDHPTTGWYHGDLLAENLLVRDGRLAAVLDFGGLAVGDQAVDLVAGWELLDAPTRETFRQELEVDDATWRRSAGWALFVAVVTFPYYWATMPARCTSRRVMVQAVLGSADI
jgi:aminoglycoside phosphotransferase (APT) family kinase protein